MNASTTRTSARPTYRRKRHYVDRSIQQSLLVAMVALEVALAAACIWLAHWRLVQLIEDSMYRMHAAQSAPTLLRLAQEAFPVLALFVVFNLIALTLVAGLWSARENLVLRDFMALIAKTQALDFSSDPAPQRPHEVLALAASWRARERTRSAAIRDELAQLEATAAANASAQTLRDALERLNKHLS